MYYSKGPSSIQSHPNPNSCALFIIRTICTKKNICYLSIGTYQKSILINTFFNAETIKDGLQFSSYYLTV